MSKDLLYQQEWQEEHPESTTINNLNVYSILHYSCGNGWQLSHTELSLEEARLIKRRYTSTNTTAKIIQEIQ